MQMQDSCGNDLTPGLKAFLEKGSKKQQKPVTAEEMLDYKRQHRAIENCLHYVLDETLGEGKSTIKLGKNTMSILRKCAYNIVWLLQMENPERQEAFRILLIMSVPI